MKIPITDEMRSVTTKANEMSDRKPIKGKVWWKIDNKVGQYTLDRKLIKVWNSQTEASRATRVAQQSISKYCYGKLKTAGGFRWSFR